MISATVKISNVIAGVSVVSISPDTKRELPRTKTSIEYDGSNAIIQIVASDTSAMRAALNSYLECIKVVEDINNLVGGKL